MSTAYQPVLWNRQKIIYDLILLGSVVLYIYLFVIIAQQVGPVTNPLDVRGIQIRAYGSAAFILLHVILSIGPLCRLSPKFLPLLYNRRHMGVTMAVLGILHTRRVLGWYHDFGNLDPLVSALVSNLHLTAFFRFPFEILGFLALGILFVMAATSHDFWLANLTAPVWKALHMLVYLAYGLLVGHVVLGALQSHRHPLLSILVGLGFMWIVAIHLVTALREGPLDQALGQAQVDGFVDVADVNEIPENRAKIVCLGGERVAVFRYEGKISAISNVCQHQNGPLGEGKILEGCITCPWHGYQYEPNTGASPPPFTEKVPTFDVKIAGDRVWVKAIPNRPGTPVEPALIAPGVAP